jgi:hypothetical protein
MKIKKLGSQGFSHDILMVFFVVVFAVAGVAYIVASRADSCSDAVSGSVSSATSEATSESVSGATSVASCPVSDTVSDATSAPGAIESASCSINNVPVKPTYGQIINPVITVSNTGTAKLSILPAAKLSMYAANGNLVSTNNVAVSANTQVVLPGSSVSIPIASYTAAYSTATQNSGVYSATGSNPGFACTTSFNLPTTPAPTPNPTPAPLASILFEGESMKGSIDNYNIADKTASAGKYRANYHSGSAAATITSKGKLTGITVRAKGTSCNGAPQMVVKVDGQTVLQASVANTTWGNSQATVSGAAGNHTVAVSFPNDRATKTCDRNLFVDSLTFTQKS